MAQTARRPNVTGSGRSFQYPITTFTDRKPRRPGNWPGKVAAGTSVSCRLDRFGVGDLIFYTVARQDGAAPGPPILGGDERATVVLPRIGGPGRPNSSTRRAIRIPAVELRGL